MKARIFSVLLAFAACFVLMYAAGSVSAVEKKAEITETTLFGDSAYADGIEVGFGGFAGDYGSYRLAWESSYSFAADKENAKQETRFVKYKDSGYSSKREARVRIETDPAIPMVLDIAEDYENGELSDDGIPSELLSDNAWENAKKVKEKFTKEYNNEAGLYIKDFFKYYPIDFNATNGTTGHYLQFESYSGIASDVMEMFNEVNRFFRIPVLEKQRVFYSFDVGANGKISAYAQYGNFNESGSKHTDEAFEFDMQGLDAGDAFYMTFDAHIEHPADKASESREEVVDTSLIPGGYGIYRLPYDAQKGEFYTDRLETVYCLDPKNYNEIVSISPDGKKLLLTVSDGTKVWAEVVRLSDMSLEQQIELMDFSGIKSAENAENAGNAVSIKYLSVRDVEFASRNADSADAADGGIQESQAKAADSDVKDSQEKAAQSAKLFYDSGKFCLLTYQDGSYEKEMGFDVEPMDLRSRIKSENTESGSTKEESGGNGTDAEAAYSLGILDNLNSLNAEEITKISYDGSRLSITGYRRIDDEFSDIFGHFYDNFYLCQLDVALADKNGLKYYGRLDTNMADFNDASAAEAMLNPYYNNTEEIEGFFSKHRDAFVQPQREKLWIRL